MVVPREEWARDDRGSGKSAPVEILAMGPAPAMSRVGETDGRRLA